MATNPDDLQRQQEQARHRREAEAAALALLFAGRKRYDLPAIIRQQRIRTRPFRQIRPTQALKANLAAPYFDIAKGWAAEIEALLAAYGLGSPAIEAQLKLATARLANIVASAQHRIPDTIDGLERWHRGQWVSRIRASTGLDVAMFTQPQDVSGDTQAAAAWNQALADDVHQQAKTRFSTALFAGAAAALPASEVKARLRDAVGKARSRAAGIADDQVDKLSRAMDRTRRQAAGLATYRWHHTEQLRPRPHHLARNGKTFADDDIEAADRCGIPPFCKCWEEPLFG